MNPACHRLIAIALSGTCISPVCAQPQKIEQGYVDIENKVTDIWSSTASGTTLAGGTP